MNYSEFSGAVQKANGIITEKNTKILYVSSFFQDWDKIISYSTNNKIGFKLRQLIEEQNKQKKEKKLVIPAFCTFLEQNISESINGDSDVFKNDQDFNKLFEGGKVDQKSKAKLYLTLHATKEVAYLDYTTEAGRVPLEIKKILKSLLDRDSKHDHETLKRVFQHIF